MKLLYFAWLRAKIGMAEERVEPPAGVTHRGGAARLAPGRAGRALPTRSRTRIVRVASISDYVGGDHPVTAGDEVALFPPVTGG